MRPRTLVFLFLAALTGLRLYCIGQHELAPDESYYYLWSQHLAPAYYSKGPGVAFTIWAGTAMFGATEFGVRFFSPILGLGTSLLIFFFARRLYGESIAAWAVLTMNAIPILQVGSIVMTIDPLSIFFWAAALYTFWIALERSPEFSMFWPITGTLIGLGFLCKYTNAMELLSIALLLGFSPRHRREFRRPGIYMLLLTFAVFIIPPILWNAEHAWITLEHLRSKGGLDSGTGFRPLDPLVFVGAHFAVYSPIIFGAMLVALFKGTRMAMTQFKARFLIAFALPLIVMYTLLSFKKAGAANWTAPAFVSLGILTVALAHRLAEERPRVRRLLVAGLFLGAVMSLSILDIDFFRTAGIPIGYNIDPGGRLRGWRTCAEWVGQYRRRIEAQEGSRVFLIANKYQTASSISFYLESPRSEGPGHPPVYIPESQAIENEFSFWPRYDELEEASAPVPGGAYTEEQGTSLFIGRDAIYITDAEEEMPPSSIEKGFERIEPLALADERRQGLPLRRMRMFLCHHYRGIEL